MKRDTTFESNGHLLSARLVMPTHEAKVALLYVAGGYNASFRSRGDWQDRLAKRGIANLEFDYCGVGESPGQLEQTNLDTRLENAKNALTYLRSEVGSILICVLGVSMGAPIAIWLACEKDIESLILTVPAAYSIKARNKNFGGAFSKAIRGDGTWHDTIEFESLERINKPIMLINALQDEVIPKAVTKSYSDIVMSKGGEVISYDVQHPFLRITEAAPEVPAQFWRAVGDFVLKHS